MNWKKIDFIWVEKLISEPSSSHSGKLIAVDQVIRDEVLNLEISSR